MKQIVICVVLALVASAFAEEPFSYEGFKTYRVVTKDQTQLNMLRSLEEKLDLDFWSHPRQVGQNVDVMVSPDNQKSFLNILNLNNFDVSVLIDNVQTTVDRENEEMARSKSFDGKIGFTQYYKYDEIVDYLNELQSNYPGLVTVSTIGTTYEGRDIKAITVSSGGNGQRNALLIEGGIHAREWIAPSTILYLLNQLVENYSANKALVDGADWILVPVSNPDGYQYTNTERMWRKNRNQVNALCKGADANRNFGFHWGGEGASTSPCAETYRGASAFSEKESSALRDVATANGGGDRIKLYLAMHSYGPYFLYPWGYQWDLPDDWEALDTLARNAVAALTAVSGTKYEIGSSTQLLYAAAGGSDDYMKGGQGIEYAYTVELPGGGSQGFNPPPSSILPVGKETFAAYQVLGAFVAGL